MIYHVKMMQPTLYVWYIDSAEWYWICWVVICYSAACRQPLFGFFVLCDYMASILWGVINYLSFLQSCVLSMWWSSHSAPLSIYSGVNCKLFCMQIWMPVWSTANH